MPDEIRIKRWNVISSDPIGLSMVVDSCWTRWGAERQARFYSGLAQPVAPIEVDGVVRPFTVFEVLPAGA